MVDGAGYRDQHGGPDGGRPAVRLQHPAREEGDAHLTGGDSYVFNLSFYIYLWFFVKVDMSVLEGG